PFKKLVTFFTAAFLALLAGCGPVQFSGINNAQLGNIGPAVQGGIPASDTQVGPAASSRCGGPADSTLYTGHVDLVKSQSQQFYTSYSECQAARASIFGNSLVCSKMVSATI